MLVVEDQQALAGALKVAIDAQADLECVGAVRSVEDAVRLVAAHRPAVVLMDVQLPGVDGIEGARRIKALDPAIRILILTGLANPDVLAEAAAAGAAGFLSKDSPFPEILTAIRAPLDGKILVEGTTLEALLARIRPGGSEPPGASAGLTAREREVLGLMGQGLAPGAIAERLVVSVHTARGYVKNIMLKLGAHSQLEAVVVATRTGLLPRFSPPAN